MLRLHGKVYTNTIEGNVSANAVNSGVEFEFNCLMAVTWFFLNGHAANFFQMKMDIAEKTRTLEFVGLSISLAALLASLAIFCRFR